MVYWNKCLLHTSSSQPHLKAKKRIHANTVTTSFRQVTWLWVITGSTCSCYCWGGKSTTEWISCPLKVLCCDSNNESAWWVIGRPSHKAPDGSDTENVLSHFPGKMRIDGSLDWKKCNGGTLLSRKWGDGLGEVKIWLHFFFYSWAKRFRWIAHGK